MLAVVSPAKSLDLSTPIRTKKRSEPRLLDDAEVLVKVMSTYSPDDLAELMGISPDLAELNVERFGDWTRPFTPDNARPAVLTFAGDVYQEMDPATFSERDLTRAQKVLRILSGLYGVLRPLDLIQPYRLEMGRPVPTDRGDDLYAFWGDRITDLLAEDLEASPGPGVLVNLASKEYFSSVDTDRLGARVITPIFLDAKGDAEPRVMGYFAKRARGSMVGWMIRERVGTIAALRDFDGLGYRYDPDRSEPDQPVFVRRSS